MRSLLLRKSGNGHCLWYEGRKVGPEALRGPSARGHREEKGWPLNIFPEMGSGCALLMTVKYVSIWREEWPHLRMEWSQDHSHSVQTLEWSCDFGRHQRTHKKKRAYGAMRGDNEELIFREDKENHRVLLWRFQMFNPHTIYLSSILPI